MCEYCGCQSLASTDEPTREHGTPVSLAGRVRQAHRDAARMADPARRISPVPGPRTEAEEPGLFPALARSSPRRPPRRRRSTAASTGCPPRRTPVSRRTPHGPPVSPGHSHSCGSTSSRSRTASSPPRRPV